ncbi:hypothetical protein KDL29_06910 [bacterium]|nr:hypothetical protein [bacterium]
MPLCTDCTAMGCARCRLAGNSAAGSARPGSPFEVLHDIPVDFRIRERAQPFFPLLCETWRVLQVQPGGYWRSSMLAALRSVRFRIMPMYADEARGIRNPRGHTIPLLTNSIRLREDVAQGCSASDVQLLLHELAHRCGAVLPEWKLWFPWWFSQGEIYGRRVNSADAISIAMMERYCNMVRWPD